MMVRTPGWKTRRRPLQVVELALLCRRGGCFVSGGPLSLSPFPLPPFSHFQTTGVLIVCPQDGGLGLEPLEPKWLHYFSLLSEKARNLDSLSLGPEAVPRERCDLQALPLQLALRAKDTIKDPIVTQRCSVTLRGQEEPHCTPRN